MCSRWIRVTTLLLVHRLIYKYFRFTGRHFEFSLIVLHSFSDTWQPKYSTDLILSKSQICIHFSGMCVLFFTRFRFLGRHLDFREKGRLRRTESWLTPLKFFHWKHRRYRHRNHVRITLGTEVRGDCNVASPAVCVKNRSAVRGFRLELTSWKKFNYSCKSW